MGGRFFIDYLKERMGFKCSKKSPLYLHQSEKI